MDNNNQMVIANDLQTETLVHFQKQFGLFYLLCVCVCLCGVVGLMIPQMKLFGHLAKYSGWSVLFVSNGIGVDGNVRYSNVRVQ